MTAVKLGLGGWVRNLPDGCVEIVAEGPSKAVESLEAWCYEGSPKSKVTKVVVEAVKTHATSTTNSPLSHTTEGKPSITSPFTSSHNVENASEEVSSTKKRSTARQFTSFEIRR